MSIESVRDPRTRLVREKYFSLRPQPLERWLWSQGVPAAAERVFWLHWQEGMKRGDWCSELPLKRVAAHCHLDVSTVTRAYQLLARLGCLRRASPGRDPRNPFQQATAITEVRLPRELLVELERHPSRRTAAAVPLPASPVPDAPAPRAADPFAGLSGRERLQALSALTRAMSAAERAQYDEAARTHREHMAFDADSRLSAEERGRVLQQLSALARAPRAAPGTADAATRPAAKARRTLSVFELARLRRDVQSAVPAAESPELVRQVVWSIEEGALRRFSPVHAIHIALKKIREGAWTRPNRMPPQWARAIGEPTLPETCRHA
jgi:hypothetical protein